MMKEKTKKMKNKIIDILSFSTAICFLICYFVSDRKMVFLMLSLTWVCIGSSHISNRKKTEKKKNKK